MVKVTKEALTVKMMRAFLPDKEKISNVLMQFFDLYQKLQGENKTYKIGKERQGDTFDKNLKGLLNLHNIIKDKLNECQ